MHLRVLCLLLLFGLAASAAPKASKEAKQEASENWEKVSSEKKKLVEKASQLATKREQCARLAQERQEKVVDSQEKVKKCLPLLLRMGRTNPLRFLVDLKATKSSVRGIILLRTVAASLARRMKKAQADLNDLQAFATDLDLQGRDLETHFQTLHAHQGDLQEKGMKAAADLKAEQEARLSEVTIHTLLDESHAVLSQSKAPSSKPQPLPNFPFSRLDPPVVGEILKDPETQKKFSPQSYGIVFKTEKSASVHTPAKGKVVFKGPFRTQGDILILDHGQNVHTVYMGMDTIKAEIGQELYAGEKIGIMPSYGKGKPLLYIELRHDGKAIDPSPYLKE